MRIAKLLFSDLQLLLIR